MFCLLFFINKVSLALFHHRIVYILSIIRKKCFCQTENWDKVCHLHDNLVRKNSQSEIHIPTIFFQMYTTHTSHNNIRLIKIKCIQIWNFIIINENDSFYNILDDAHPFRTFFLNYFYLRYNYTLVWIGFNIMYVQNVYNNYTMPNWRMFNHRIVVVYFIEF